MMKTIIGLLTLVLVSSGVLIGTVLPKQFHQKVHQELIPILTPELERSYQENLQQTIIQSAMIETTVTTVTSLNPQNYHILVVLKNKVTSARLEAKIYATITKDLQIHVELQDYKDESFSVLAPVITLSTPIKRELLTGKRGAADILFNSKIEMRASKVAASHQVYLVLIDDLRMSLGLQSRSADKVSLQAGIKTRQTEMVSPEFKGKYSGLDYQFEIDSFSASGVLAGQETLKRMYEDEMPIAFKLMTSVPALKAMVHFPLAVKFDFKIGHESGDSSVSLKINLDDPEKSDIYHAVSGELEGAIPKPLLRAQIISALAEQFSQKYRPYFNPASDGKESLSEAFKIYFASEREGKSRLEHFLDTLVAKRLLLEKDNVYAFNGSLSQMKLKLNGEAFTGEDPSEYISPREISDFMLARGFRAAY
jgi:hypothetical protein